MKLNPRLLEPFDEVIISGTASSPSGLRLDRVPAVVATVDIMDHCLKVWPKETLPGAHDDKVWVPFDQITELVLAGAP